MKKEVEKLAAFVVARNYYGLSSDVIQALKIRILDSVGCAIGALQSPVVKMLKAQLDDFGGNPLVTLIGGGKTAPDRAALYNSALVRYLDFNDSFLAQHETCHPSDNFGAVLAAGEYANATGKELICALGISYQVQCRLSEEAPVRKKGFDHTTQGAYAVAAGVAKLLQLSEIQTAHAISMAAVANNALRVTRTGDLSHWKGLAYPNTSFAATHAAFLALRGVTGPLEIFEGNKGFKESISGPFTIDWEAENIDIVLKSIIKKYNAEIHSQSVLEGIMELRERIPLLPHMIEKIDVEIFDVAYNIIGGGEEGGKKEIRTKEEADHSLPYMIAVALCDGEVTPRQYAPDRIGNKDVQELLRKVHIRPNEEFTKRFPGEMAAHITVTCKDGREVVSTKKDYQGFFTRPMDWDEALKKFDILAPGNREIAEAILRLDSITVRDFTTKFARGCYE